ncbi:MAG: tetratricopeptide repeat protein [Pseudomonadota bacterium]
MNRGTSNRAATAIIACALLLMPMRSVAEVERAIEPVDASRAGLVLEIQDVPVLPDPENDGALPDEALPQMPSPDEEVLTTEDAQELDLPAETMARDEQLRALFDMLGDPDQEAWQIIQSQIWRVWRRSGSDSVDFLMRRAREKMEAEDYEAALVHLDDIVRLAPEFAEGWNQRATVHFLQGRYGASVADIEAVLTLEPRHFGALSGLGIILDRTGQDAQAYEVFKRVLEIHPNQPGAQAGIDRLAKQVEGRDS